MSEVALRIKRLRIKSGITQNEMAEKIHLSLKAWQKIENGITKLDLDRLNQIAAIFKVSLIDLITNESDLCTQQINFNNNTSPNEPPQNATLSDGERVLFYRMINDKDREIEFLRTLIKERDNNKEIWH